MLPCAAHLAAAPESSWSLRAAPPQSDLLVNYLAEAEAVFHAQAQDPLYRPALHAGLLQPRLPISADSLLVPRMRCYGATQSSVMGALQGL
jgi:hypothetical protein